MPDVDSVHLSVVIPAFNEAARLPATLASVLEYLRGQSYGAEVIVVDDGSSDSTGAVVKELAARSPILHLRRHADGGNHGKGAAVRLGMIKARGDYRLFMDADNSTRIVEIEAFWRWFNRGYDIVIGSRNVPGSRVEVHQAWYKEMAGRMGNRLIQMLAVPGIRDTQAGFKCFTGRCAEAVFPRMTIDRWGFDVEALAVARLFGFVVREVPIAWANAEGSKVGPGSYLSVLGEVLSVRRNVRSGIYKKPAPQSNQDSSIQTR